jgi:hypothetical protein
MVLGEEPSDSPKIERDWSFGHDCDFAHWGRH